MDILIGYPKVIEVKGKGWKFLSFPLYMKVEEDFVIVVKGFRIMKERIYPPAVQSGKMYINIWQNNGAFAQKLYEVISLTVLASEKWRKALEEVGGLGSDAGAAGKLLLYDPEATRLLFE